MGQNWVKRPHWPPTSGLLGAKLSICLKCCSERTASSQAKTADLICPIDNFIWPSSMATRWHETTVTLPAHTPYTHALHTPSPQAKTCINITHALYPHSRTAWPQVPPSILIVLLLQCSCSDTWWDLGAKRIDSRAFCTFTTHKGCMPSSDPEQQASSNLVLLLG